MKNDELVDYTELQKTDTWYLYEKSVEFLQRLNIYGKSDMFNRFYLGDQWHGLKLSKSVEPVCLNIIQQIVKQKVSTVTENLFAINYSPENGDNQEFIVNAQEVCKSLNRYASKVWDFDQMDYKIKMWAKKNAIQGISICYVDYDKKQKRPVNEDIKCVDIMVGDENSTEIQTQPYILVRQRVTVQFARKLAKENGLSDDKIANIIPDDDTSTISGQTEELENKVWLITKFWKDDEGTVHYGKSVKFVDIVEDENMGIKLYPFAVWDWEEREGSFRGVGEVEFLKNNQIEINRTIMRRLITVKTTAYPQKVVNEDSISNIQDVDRVGATIRFKDVGGLRASDVFMMTSPAQMSTDAEKVQAELINLSKDLSNVSEATTGNLDPSSASGRAILAVQQAQNQPLNDQVIGLKKFLEDIARIWFEYWKKNSEDLVVFFNEKDPLTNQEMVLEAQVDKKTMKRLEAFVKVDITPRGAYDRYAQELSLENLMTGGFIDLEEYTESLDADSVMPKTKLEKILRERVAKQQAISDINLEAEQIKDMANAQLNDAQSMIAINDEAQSIMGQAMNEAQSTSYGADRNATDVSNNVNLGG